MPNLIVTREYSKVYFLSAVVIISTFLFSILVLAIFSFPMAKGNTNNLTIYTPDSHPYGLSYGEWTAKWWQWFTSIPNDANHPLNDATGASCARNQAGPVWFLGGYITGYAVKTCNIPAGKAILFPTIAKECSIAEFPSLKTESDLRTCAASAASHFRNFEVTIDGSPVKDMEKYNVLSPLFYVRFPDHPIFAAHAGPSQAMSAGNWVFLGPLSPGTHDIHRKAESVDFTGVATQNFAQDITYHLTVK
jgi:hypothetical protein